MLSVYDFGMTHYFISFNDGDMTFPPEDFPAVGAAAHAVMREAIEAGVWVFGGGFEGFRAHVVTADGSVTPGPLSESNVRIGGFTILNVQSEEEVNLWAAKIAQACRCSQEVRLIMDDPEQDLLVGER